MSEIVHSRLHEVCPVKSVDDMGIDEVESDCVTAFEIIGYTPNNLSYVVEQVYLNEDILALADFIYEVWKWDNEQE